MSYHRGGHSGAVAVSFSAMSPLSPTRRCPGNAGSGTSVTSGTNGTTTSKYSNYRSSTPSSLGNDRNGGYYSSASNAGYRASSYTSSASSDTFRRNYYSPARSVSSYESSSIVGTSSINGTGLRYGSASTSSASSSAGSSNSSCASRDRGSLQHHTPSSLATTAADLYAIYSPTNYVPNIHGGKSSSHSLSSWRPSSSASSSGVSTCLNSELHGSDEYDTCRDRRDRSYSSEISSGLGNTSNNTSPSSNNQNSCNERWIPRREINKRRATPTIVNGVTNHGTNNLITGNANKTDLLASPTIEVTVEPAEESERSRARFNEADSLDLVVASELSHDSAKVSDNSRPRATNIETLERNNETPIDGRSNSRIVNNENNREPDNNNRVPGCKGRSSDESIVDSLECVTRRESFGRSSVEQSTPSVTSFSRDESERREARDANLEGRKNFGTLERRYDRDDKADDLNVRENGGNKAEKYRYDDPSHRHHRQHHRHDHHHQHRGLDEESGATSGPSDRKNDLDIPNLSLIKESKRDDDSASSSVARPCRVASTSSSSVLDTADRSVPSRANTIAPSPTSRRNFEELKPELARNSRARLKDLEVPGKRGEPAIRVDSYDSDVPDEIDGDKGTAGGGGGGVCVGAGVVVVVAAAVDGSAEADNHRKAFTRTKIPTNNDNTELLTNNNVQDREDHLGIVETATRKIGNEARLLGAKDDARSCEMIKGTRKSLLWTATNEDDGKNVDEPIADRANGALTNGDRSLAVADNRYERPNDQLLVDDSPDRELDDNNKYTEGYGRNGHRSNVNRSDDVDKASRRTVYGWNDSNIDDLTGASSSSSSSSSSSTAASSSVAASSSSSNNSVPVAVHQNLYRGLNEQIDESSNSRPPRSRLQSRKDERYGLNGLRNIGNTCFMNSVIQCLSNTRPLLEYLLNEQHLQDINTTTSSMKGALIKAFGQVIQELWEMSGDHVVNTTALKSQIQRFAPRFIGYSQQDAQEFLRYLLEGLHEDVNRVTVKPQPILTDIPDHYSDSHKASESWKRYLRSEDSTIVDVFVGQLRSSLLCTACDHVSVTLDPFWDLSLPIPMRLGTVKLNQCLEHFTKAETLDGDEKPTCSKCQMRRKCTKSFSIQKFPKILVIHLKRFSPTERFRGKLSVLVDFPLTGLDLSAFAAPGVQGCTYNLYGVANHSGTTYSGHYTAYCKHPYSGEWHEYNDSRVSTVPARSVVSSEAYVLFYEQQPASPHL